MKSTLTKLLAYAAVGMGLTGLFIRRTMRGGEVPSSANPNPAPHLNPRRQAVIDIALGELGAQDPDKYWAAVQPRLEGTGASWCGGFALWVLHQAGLTGVPWEVGKGFCYRLHTVRSPEPGDIAYFTKNQHHAIVQSVGNGVVYTIDGNQAGETVAQKVHPLSDVAAFYSINSLLQDNIA